MAYATVAEYKAHMAALTRGQPAGFLDADDTFISNCLTAAQTFVEEQTGRRFEAASETRYYDSRSIDYLNPQRLLLDYDLLSVTTLTNGDSTVIPSDGYWLEPFNATPRYAVILKSSYTWSFSTDGRISIAGSWGYSSTASLKVKDMTIRLAYLEAQRRTATGEVTVLGEGAFTFQASLPKDIAEWLTFWRRVRVH